MHFLVGGLFTGVAPVFGVFAIVGGGFGDAALQVEALPDIPNKYKITVAMLQEENCFMVVPCL